VPTSQSDRLRRVSVASRHFPDSRAQAGCVLPQDSARAPILCVGLREPKTLARAGQRTPLTSIHPAFRANCLAVRLAHSLLASFRQHILCLCSHSSIVSNSVRFLRCRRLAVVGLWSAPEQTSIPPSPWRCVRFTPFLHSFIVYFIEMSHHRDKSSPSKPVIAASLCASVPTIRF